MRIYNMAQNTTKTLFTDIVASPATIYLYRPAIYGSVITYAKIPFGAQTTTSDTIWRMNIDGSGVQQIATTQYANVNIAMDANYAAWDEDTGNQPILDVYNLQTNSPVTLPSNMCNRPQLYKTLLTCIQWAQPSILVINLSTNAYSIIADPAVYTSLTQDRIIWSDDGEM